jgi:hypothetical protein
MTRNQNSRSNRFSAFSAARLLLLVTLALAAFSLVAHAQGRRSPGRSSSAPAGASASQGGSYGSSHVTFGAELAFPYTFGTVYSHSASGIGYHIGAVADIPMAPKTGILVKAGYESKNMGASASNGSQSVDGSLTLNYMEVAGLVRQDISEGISIQGGMAVQIGIGGSYSQTTQAGGARSTENLNGTLTVPMQIALTAGAGYRIPVSATMDLVPSASFNLFLTSPSPAGDDHINTFTLGARLMFR